MQEKFEIWIARFNEAPINLNGVLYLVTNKELKELYHYKTHCWHPDGPSTWMTVAIFNLVRRKYPKLTEKEHLCVAGHVLRIDWNKVVGGIRWHEGYMTFHDGGEYKVLQGDYVVSW